MHFTHQIPERQNLKEPDNVPNRLQNTSIVLIPADGGVMQQMWGRIGLATIWILLGLVLIVSAIVSTARPLKRGAGRDKAA